MHQRKRTTIFRQLIVSVLLPVVVLISGMSLLNFNEKKDQINQSRKETIKLIQGEIGEFLTFFDFTLFEIEKEMAKQGEHFAEILTQDVFFKTADILEVNMDSVRNTIGMSASQDIYIIDTNGVVVNTTYDKDMGLNFYTISDYFIGHFQTIRKRQEFIADRISIEMTTNLPKKYMYRTTNDSKYIVELGFYSEPAKNLVTHFIDKLNSMPQKYEGIDTVSLFFGTNGFASYQKHFVPKRDSLLALKTLTTGEETSSEYSHNDLNYTSEYSLINMESSLLHKGYVIRIVHNDKLVRELINTELRRFVFNLLIFVFPIFLLILWRAKVLSKPISDLVKKMENVQSGKLDERVVVVGNNEVADLSEHFNSMIDQLQESYENLEQKVRDRTYELQEQKEMVEEAHKEITDSINYAERLQRSLMASKELLDENLSDYFVYFNPKEAVSGDFYWASYASPSKSFYGEGAKASDADGGEERFILVCADSTGHGVPGAIMSMMNMNSLKEAVKDGYATSDEILNQTRRTIIETLANDGSAEGGKDGMDAALIILNQEKTQLEFSLANNPLWLIRNDELIEFKPDKMPVGRHDNQDTLFSKRTMDLQKGDMIYIFTDGYADQFGGEKGKKFKYAALKELFLSICTKPVTEQNEILSSTFENWRKNLEQVDDVCVIGVRI